MIRPRPSTTQVMAHNGCGWAASTGLLSHSLPPSPRWRRCSHPVPQRLPPPVLPRPAEVAAKKAALEARREERRKAMAELQARKRMLGNIVFVGQLFK